MAEDLSEIKRVLRSAYWMQKRLDADLEYLARLRAKAEAVGVQYDRLRVSCEKHNSLEEAACMIVEYEKKIEVQTAKWKAALEQVMKVIYGIEDQRYQILLLYRYRDFLPWEQIAVKLGYSWQYVHRLHKRALKAASDVWHGQKEAIEGDSLDVV